MRPFADRQGNFEQAISTVQDWLRIDPNDAHSIKEVDGLRAMIERTRTIDTMIEQGRHRQAVAQIDDLLKDAPASRELRIRKLEALVGCRRYDEAFQFSNTLLRPSETNTTVLYWRAKALYYLVSTSSSGVVAPSRGTYPLMQVSWYQWRRCAGQHGFRNQAFAAGAAIGP